MLSVLVVLVTAVAKAVLATLATLVVMVLLALLPTRAPLAVVAKRVTLVAGQNGVGRLGVGGGRQEGAMWASVGAC